MTRNQHDAARARLETLLPHAGRGSRDGEPLVPGIVQSTTFCRDGLSSHPAHAYSRQSNPTVAALEEALGELENAPPAVAYSSGLAAENALFQTLLRSGDHVVCSRALYGGTTRILRKVFARFGVEASFVDSTDPAAVERELRPETRLVFLETPSNPTLEITDVAAVAEISHRAGALVAVDNTFLTPLLQQPLELGADFSVSSTTKFLEGHSAALGGAIVARDAERLDELRFVRTCIGSIQTPFNAWLTLQGLKTLAVRLERQCETARELAEWLAGHPSTRRVLYPTLAAPAQRAIAERQHLGAHGAVVSFELESGADGARRVLERVRSCRLVEHVGSVDTLLTHSATMTHASVPRDERERVGITDGLLRISVGLEPLGAIAGDLEQAFGPERAGAAREAASCEIA
jgi:cystathionine beta-lyase/cystathionine gamma-synthase